MASVFTIRNFLLHFGFSRRFFLLVGFNFLTRPFRPFVAILNGRDLTERARAYLPEGYTVPSTFHGVWLPDGPDAS